VVDDPSDARGAVDAQEADVAVTIPEGFTEAATEGAQATIYMYQDPTLTLGPRIVEMIVRGVVDGFAGSTIAVEVAADQLTARGAAVDADTQQTVRAGYQAWAMELGTDQQAGVTPLLDVQALEGEGTEAADPRTQTISLIMAGMMVFYVFFTGAVSAQSILQEEEEGTLARLFTTPTSQSTILGGKFLAAFATLFIQVAVLVVISSLIFGIDWGPPELVALMTLGQVIVATSFGIFITSLLKNTKQTGIVYGGVMTVAGMVGMASVFTASAPTGAGIADTISLVVPQGWAVRGWRLLLEGGSVSDVMVTAAVLLGLGVLFFSFGVLKFRKRFA
jgi:ABC-2 type transport system permease protein